MTLITPTPDPPLVNKECAGIAAKRGELAGNRTQDPRLKRALLYQLSYELAFRPLFPSYHKARRTICRSIFVLMGQGIHTSGLSRFVTLPAANRNTSSSSPPLGKHFQIGNQNRWYDGTRGLCGSDYKWGINARIAQKMRQFRSFLMAEKCYCFAGLSDTTITTKDSSAIRVFLPGVPYRNSRTWGSVRNGESSVAELQN